MENDSKNENPRPWLDLHTHTTFSDGDLSPEEMVELAGERGLTHIAITDHIFTHSAPVRVVALDRESAPDLDDETLKKIEGDALSDKGFTEYLKEIERIRAAEARKGLHVFAGGELDFIAAEGNAHLMADALNRLDFLLVENVHGGNWKRFRSFLELLEIPVGLAHIEIPSSFPEVPPKMLATALAEVDVFIELNAASLWRVESFHESAGHFAELAERGQRLSFGSDLHGIQPVPDALVTGWEFVLSNNLERSFEWVRSLAKGPATGTDSHNLTGAVKAEEKSAGEGGRQV